MAAVKLSDDELIVIDPMFDSFVPHHALLAENYADFFNVSYSHALTANELDRCLAKLIQRGLLFAATQSPRPAFGLTEKGGALWQAERKPHWDLYCVVSEGVERADKCSIELTAFSRDAGREYLALAKSCGLYLNVEPDRLSWTRPRRSRIYWMRSPWPWRTRATVRKGPWHSIDAIRFNRDLTSWSTISDLKKCR